MVEALVVFLEALCFANRVTLQHVRDGQNIIVIIKQYNIILTIAAHDRLTGQIAVNHRRQDGLHVHKYVQTLIQSKRAQKGKEGTSHAWMCL